MVEPRAARPAGSAFAVARLARGREAGRRVVRPGGALVVGLVAADAVARRARVDAVPVARVAGLGRVHAEERERRVVEARAGEGRRRLRVARLAVDREAGGRVVRRPGPAIVGVVARDALRARGLRRRGPCGRSRTRAAGARCSAACRCAAPCSQVTAVHDVVRWQSSHSLPRRSLVEVVLPPDPVAVVAARRRALGLPVHVARRAGHARGGGRSAETPSSCGRRGSGSATRRACGRTSTPGPSCRGAGRCGRTSTPCRRGSGTATPRPAGNAPSSRLWHCAHSSVGVAPDEEALEARGACTSARANAAVVWHVSQPRAQLAEVRVLVAGGAVGAEPLEPRAPCRCPPGTCPSAGHVALLAGHLLVLAGERERRALVREARRRRTSRRVDRVAGLAGRAELAEVRVLVARRAGRRARS